jgi:hypothetical protein
LSNLGEIGKGKSDTNELSQILFNEDMATLKRLQPLLEAYFDYNRIAVLHQSGEVLVFNREAWHEEDGILYSNTSFKPYVATKWDVGSLVDDREFDYSGWQKELRQRLLAQQQEGQEEEEEFEGYYCANTFQDTFLECGFQWDNYELLVQIDGKVVRDRDTEEEVFGLWFEHIDFEWPDMDAPSDMHIINNMTYDLLEQEKQWTSTPRVSPRPLTATVTASSPPTSTASSPSPSSSTAKSPASIATSSAPPTTATASPSRVVSAPVTSTSTAPPTAASRPAARPTPATNTVSA